MSMTIQYDDMNHMISEIDEINGFNNFNSKNDLGWNVKDFPYHFYENILGTLFSPQPPLSQE